MELMQEPTQPAPAVSLYDQVAETLLALRPAVGADLEQIDQATRDQAQAIMHLLNEEGHYMPGCPPARQILEDAKSFAFQLMITMLALRVLNMLANETIATPESKGATKFINDYIEGKNHGPAGKPMLWPKTLPGLAHLFRQWGYRPTDTTPAFVARGGGPLSVQ